MQSGSLTAGTIVVQRFEVEGHVGSGGMGTVFRARDLTTGNPVAIKLLLSSSTQPQEEERFAREAQVLSELRHPGIVSYVAHGRTADGQPFLAMEWIEGVELETRLQHGSLTVPECMTLLHKTSEALAAAHRRGIVHRDLKPSNIILRDGRIDCVALLDFGIARSAFSSAAMTHTGLVVGTPGYMAPEQARGHRNIGPSADIFSLACVLYECLTGQPPFSGAHIAVQLAKILFEEATPARQLRGTVPEALDALLMRMLAKNPEQRPSDAEELLVQLAGLEKMTLDNDSTPTPRVKQPRTTLAGSEQQLVSVVVGALRRTLIDGMPTLGWEEVEKVQSQRAVLTAPLTAYGIQAEWLADGSLVATLTGSGSATDQAAAAARCALALQERWPEALVALATGRGVLHQTLPVGESIDRAFALLRQRALETASAEVAGALGVHQEVWLDSITAGLLDGRFQVKAGNQYAVLIGERGGDQTRLLLGRPTPCVGREQELAVLDVVLSSCISDSLARAVLVTAVAGMGKSRLRHEFLRRLEPRRDELTVMFGRGDPMTAGSPYVLLAEALRRECRIQSGEAIEWQRIKLHERLGRHLPRAEAPRVIEFLGELCGVEFSDENSVLLRSARQDPKIMSEQVNHAFVDFLRAECAHRPLLLVVEDLHWGDMLSVKLIDTALRDLEDRPLMVLGLTRPEGSKLFPALWEERGLQELRLTPLTKKASERLVTQVLGPIVPATLNRIVEQASGNALFLEELIRAVAEDKGDELPGTVLAMVQSRLQRIEPGARRVLRAASLFGQTFWSGGLLALSASRSPNNEVGHTEAQELDAWLRVLVDTEAIERHRESRFPQEIEYGFRHALMREAAYSMLTEDDRRLGHQIAAHFLETDGERDPMVLAGHFQRAGDPQSAIPYYLRAADQSYDSNDLAEAILRAERGVACGATGEPLGSLRLIQMLVHTWQTRWDSAYAYGSEALSLLTLGSYRWCKATGHMFGISAMMSEPNPAAIGTLVQRFLSIDPTDDARGAYLEAAAIIMSVFSWGGMRDAALHLKSRMESISGPIIGHDATARGWLNFSLSWFTYLMEPSPWKTVELAREAMASFRNAGDLRNQVFAQSMFGRALVHLGRYDEGKESLRASLALARRLGEGFPLATAQIYMAPSLLILPDTASLAEARGLAEEILASRDLNAIYPGWAHNVLARIALIAGHFDDAGRHAEQAHAILAAVPMFIFETREILIRIELGRGNRETALERARQALAALRLAESAGHIEVALRLACAEALHAAGETAEARTELAAAQAQIERRIAQIPAPADQARYRSAVPVNARVAELAAAWGAAGA